MPVLVLAFLIGVVAGSSGCHAAPAAVSWAARLGWLHVEGTPFAFLRTRFPRSSSRFSRGELVNDKLPKTPSRKAPASFGARIVMGASSGAALGASRQRSVRRL